MQTIIEQFHWIRPQWFLALLPLALLLWLGWRYSLHSRGWRGVVDPRLLPWLVEGEGGRRRLWPLFYWGLLGVLTTMALAGPAWRQLPTPVYQQSSALIVALDLSASMNAQDLKPSRIARARLKLLDLLRQRQRVSGQTALIAFAGTAYTVTPLTDDVRTIESLVSSLSPEIMPAQGSRGDRAIELARQLLTNTGLQRGDLLLMTDGLSRTARERVESMDFGGLRISVMGIGTPEGAPIPDVRGGFIKDRNGAIVIARLDEAPLRQLAAQGGGIYTAMRIDDSDLQALRGLIEQPLQLGEAHEQADFQADRWREEGPWLLLLILPLAALALRRGFVIGLLVALLLAPLPGPSFADGDQAAEEPAGNTEAWWQRWLLNPDQRARKALEQGDADKAEQLFRRPDWKAAAAYQAGRYEEAARLLETLPEKPADVLYNRANALAKAGRLEDALTLYDQVLEQNPDDKDARYNRKLVEEALRQRQQQNQQAQNPQGQNQQGQNQQGQNPQGQNPQGQNPQDPEKSMAAGQDQADPSGEESAPAVDEARQRAAIERLKAEAEARRKETEEAAAQARASGEAQKSAPRNGLEAAAVDTGVSTPEQSLEQQAEAQWLRRIPDDPGGLLRNKFRYQYRRQAPAQTEDEPW